MSSTVALSKGVGDASTSDGAQHLRFRLVSWGILLALVCAIVLLRLYRLSEPPPGIYFDEGVNGNDALRVLGGEHAVFFPKNSGREGLLTYAIAVTTSLLGRTVLALRLPAALASGGAVLAVFWLGRALFGEGESGRPTPWRGLLIGGVAAALLAFSLGYTILGRIAFRANFLPLLLCLSVTLLWEGWRRRSLRGGGWWRIALGGVCLGLVPYTYIASRFVPVLFLLFGLSFLFYFRGDIWEIVRAASPRAGLFLGVAAVVAAPLLAYFALQPEHFFLRSRELWVLDPSHNQGNPIGAVLGNIWEHLLAFGIRGDPNLRHNFEKQPLLNPAEAIFFWFGVGMVLWRWQRPAYRLLLLWLATMLLPAMLALDGPPHTLRMIGAAPAIYLLIVLGAWEVFQLLRGRSRALQGRTFLIVTAALVGGALLVQGGFTFHTYFKKWVDSPEVYREYRGEWTELARTLNTLPSPDDAVYLIGNRKGLYPSFEYLYDGEAPAYVIYADGPNLPQKIQVRLAGVANLSNVKVVTWKEGTGSFGEEQDDILDVMDRFGRHQGTSDYASFQIHSFNDADADNRWSFYEFLEPLAVLYDDGIDLRGIALGQGAEQFSSERLVELDQEGILWVSLQWRTTPALTADFAISMRLYDVAGGMLFQRDAILVNMDGARTSGWSTEEAVENSFDLRYPEGYPPGEYELRLVVYNTESTEPTVEIGVWEAESVLARLRVVSPD